MYLKPIYPVSFQKVNLAVEKGYKVHMLKEKAEATARSWSSASQGGATQEPSPDATMASRNV